MAEKSEKKSVFEGERYTPLFEDMPEGMLLSDIAVYGYIRRMEQLRDKKCTASSATIGKAIHANEKTVDRSLSRLETWNIIRCTHRGRETKEASHFITLPVSSWNVEDIQDIAVKKTTKRKEAYKTRKEKEESLLGSICPDTRVNLSGDRVKLTHKEVLGELIRRRENSNFELGEGKPQLPSMNLPLPKQRKKPAQKENDVRFATKKIKTVWYQDEPAE